MNRKVLAVITIPEYITTVQISETRRAKYYTKKTKNIPKTYREKYTFNKKGYLVDKEGKKIIANPRSVGTPRFVTISGNQFYSGYGGRGGAHTRAKIVRELKAFYMPFVEKAKEEYGVITQFPIQITWDIYRHVEDEPDWDVSNLQFYYKYFEDCLRDPPNPMIPDDTVKYITWAASPKIIPVDTWEERKFVFKILYDERRELRRSPWV